MRNMAFSLTYEQMMAETKDVTRRLGWARLLAGDQVMAVKKGMGLKRGEKVHRIYPITIVRCSWEPINYITPQDVIREGFPDMTVAQFIDFFCLTHKCKPDQQVNRIEFRKSPAT
jgi:hypothetical protein